MTTELENVQRAVARAQKTLVERLTMHAARNSHFGPHELKAHRAEAQAIAALAAGLKEVADKVAEAMQPPEPPAQHYHSHPAPRIPLNPGNLAYSDAVRD